ncbi:UNVERIFIED_CONTAM: hypothetical protein K2H54_027576 [Gekko kuhli]
MAFSDSKKNRKLVHETVMPARDLQKHEDQSAQTVDLWKSENEWLEKNYKRSEAAYCVGLDSPPPAILLGAAYSSYMCAAILSPVAACLCPLAVPACQNRGQQQQA